MFEHLSAALQDEETGHGNMGQLVQVHLPSIQKEFRHTSSIHCGGAISLRQHVGGLLEVRERLHCTLCV